MVVRAFRHRQRVSIPSRGFWFFEADDQRLAASVPHEWEFQSPRGDFGFLKANSRIFADVSPPSWFQSPRGDFGFLKVVARYSYEPQYDAVRFNPLAGILVF